MKRTLSFTLALLMIIPMILGALPQFSFAEAVEITDNSGYSGGIRKKSDGSVLFSPFMTPVKDAVAAGAKLSDYTVKMTFTLLSGADGNAICTFDTVHAALNTSNGSYYDIYLNGSKGNSGFCPEAGKYYNIYVEVVTGFGTDAETVAFYGTYKSMQAASAISSSSYYDPTPVKIPSLSETGIYSTGIRKKSDGRILFSPAMSDLRAEVAAGKSLSDFSVKATFHLLGEDDTVAYSYPTVELTEIIAGNGNYVDIVLMSDTVNAFCPEAGKSYKIDVQICYQGAPVYEGSYGKITAPDAITGSSYYNPTVSVSEFDNYNVYGGGIRKSSKGYVIFSPYINPASDDIVAGKDYIIKTTFTLLDENDQAEYTWPTITFTEIGVNSAGGYFVNLNLIDNNGSCGFCPTAGRYYSIEVEVYEGSSLRYAGTFEKVLANENLAESEYYAPTKKGVQLDETKEDYTGSVLYSGGIRKNSKGKILFSPFMQQLRSEVVDGGKSYGDFSIKATFHLLDDNKDVVASFPATMTPSSSNGYYTDIPFAGCGFCPTAGKYYDVDVEIYEKGNIKYYGTYKNVLAATAIAESSEYQPTAIPGQPSEFNISLSYSFNNTLAGSAAGNVYFTVDKAGYFEVRWADAEGEPLTAVIGSKTLPYSPLAKISITAADGGSHMEKMIGFTAIPQGAAKLVVTDSAMNVLETLDLPANKLLAEEDYTLSFGTISDLHYNYFWLDSEKTQDAAIGAVDRALAFYEALGVDLITAAGDYSLYNEENSYQKYQAAVSKITTPVLACAGNHEVYTWNGDKMYAPGSYWLTYMNNGFYDGQIEGVLDIAENGVDLAYSIPGAEEYVFISLNQWYYDNHTTTQESLLKDEQLEWLAEMFETYKDKTVYLLFHTYLGDDDFETIDGQGDMTNPGGYTYGSFYNQYTDDEAVLRSLLETYENVVWFNGHSHYEYSIQKYNENLNIFDYYGSSATMVHVPSVTNMRTVSDTSTGYSSMYGSGASQGALTLAYDGYQIINGVDIQNEEILSFATFIVYDDKTVTGEIEDTDVTWTYDEQLNSLRFDGTGAMPDYTAASETPFAQYMNSVKTVYVADGITYVGANTFNGCAALTNASLKNSVTAIGAYAFAGTSIDTLTLPKTLVTVNDGAFNGISSVINVTYYGSSAQWPTITIGQNNEALTGATVSFRSYVITWDVNGETITTEVPVKKVPTFDGRPVKEHEDPNKYYTFVGWTDGTTTYAPGTELPKATKDATYTALFVESADERIATGFVGTITWSLDKVTGILTVSGSGATPDWTNDTKSAWHEYADLISEVVVTEGITTIGSYAFSGLKNLTKVTLPNGLTTLRADAFSYNSNLKTLVLPSTVTTVGQGVTYQTNNIQTLYYGCGAEAWAIFVAGITSNYNDSLKNATPVFAHECALECSTTDETHTIACASCSFSITAKHSFGEGVPGAPGTLEKTCGSCGYVKIENLIVTGTIGTITWSLDQTTGVLTISGTGAMPNWSADSKVGAEWHAYASLITKVIVEEGVTTVGNFAFSGLQNLTEVVLPEGVTAINADAFSYNSALKTLHLPVTLGFIGQGILFGSGNVTTVYYSGCAHDWADLVESITTAYNDTVKEASPVFAKTTTCVYVDNDTHKHVCDGCGAETSGAHTEGEIYEVEATTEAPGGKFYVCPDCGEVITVEVYEQLTGSDGDINMDGAVDISDVTDLLKYLAASDELKAEMIESNLVRADALNCDGSEDGTVDISDVTHLLKILAGTT